MRRPARGPEGPAGGPGRARAAAILAVALALGCLGVAVASGTSASGTPVSVSISATRVGKPVSSGFVGLAFEFRSVPAFIGRDPRSPNPVIVQLIRNLAPGQRPVIRIGGESTDRAWWPVPHMRRPYGITEDLTPSWLRSARTLVNAVGGRLILGLNLEANRTTITQTEGRALIGGIGRAQIQAVEIGNEPELYTVVPWYELNHGKVVPWYHKRQGTPVLARKPGYDVATYTGELSRYRRVVPGVPIAAPSTGSYKWLTQLPSLLSAEPNLSMVTFHRYGLNGCVVDRASPEYPTISNLLSPFASRGIMNGVGGFVALAHAHGLPFRIDEMNSVTCGGRHGVSDTFASALWVIDTLFQMAGDGVDGINIHTFEKSANGLFDFTVSHGHWRGSVHPEYYGLMMFAQAAPPGAKLLRVAASSQPDVRSWATLAPDGRIRLVLINDSLSSSHSVLVHAAESAAARIERLEAPSAEAKHGVTIGGQSFGSRTSTGTLPGRARDGTVAERGGAYAVTLPASSAAMLTWPAR
jgi:hypothetical protein